MVSWKDHNEGKGRIGPNEKGLCTFPAGFPVPLREKLRKVGILGRG
jgi:hypothetical protein